MMPKRTTSLVFAAACLTAIAAISAHAQPASTYGATPGYTTPPGAATYGSPPGYTTPPGAATYGSPPGYTTPPGAATYGSPPGYTTPPGAATYGSPPGYTTPQGSATYGATPGYMTPQNPAAYGSAPGYTTPQGSAPHANQGDVPQSAAARQNVIESRQYDRELETNRAFRQARMRKECGPISDPELRQSCLASFNQDEPSGGSSGSSRARRSGSGR